MKRILTGHDEVFGPWIMAQTGGHWLPGMGSTIGLWDDEVGPIAAALYCNCNGASVAVHLAGVGKKWMNREYLWYCFHYPFEELKVNKLLGLVESTNAEAIRLNLHFGYTIEATLKDAAPKGDLLVMTMTKDQCKWLTLKDRYRGQTLSAASS